MRDTNIDIQENVIRSHGDLLSILLADRTRTTASKICNILWSTDSYEGYKPKEEIQIEDITGRNEHLIQPRIAKPREEQKSRTQDKGEVFTPTDIVDSMNKQIDNSSPNWPAMKDNWKEYVKELRLEITCGEAPFIVNRYNAANGVKVKKVGERVGFLDRKLRIVSENCNDKKTWLEWAIKAFKASYGYEWQGDNLLLARENLFYTFIDYWNDKFPNDKINLERKISDEKLSILQEIATIISWNIFQMDGLKFVVPMSCKSEVCTEEIPPILAFLGEKPDKKAKKKQCPGCAKNDPFSHNGKYVKIMDWKKNKTIRFVDLLNNKEKK